MKNSSSSKTNDQMKILYALGMIFIISGHSGNGGISLFYDWFPVYSFHLALFVFISGYFYKEESEQNVHKYIIRKFKKLIIPLYLWNLFYGGVVTILHSNGFKIGVDANLKSLFIDPILTGHQFEINLAGWFVIPLFMIQVYNILARRFIKLFVNSINDYVWVLFNLALGILGTILASSGYNTGWYLVIVRMLVLLPYYSMGFLYNKRLESKDRLVNWMYFGLIFLMVLIILFRIGRIPTYHPSWCNNYIDGPVIPFVVAVLGIAFWLRIGRLVVPVLKDSKIIDVISQNTFSIMINQYFGFFVIKTIFALCNKVLGICRDFDFGRYHESLSYFYLPHNDSHFFIIYLIGGILIPLLMQMIVTKLYTLSVVIIKSQMTKLNNEK